MRLRSSLGPLAGLGLLLLAAGACNSVFGIDAGMPASAGAGGAAGMGGEAGSPSSVTSAGGGGTPDDGGQDGDAAPDHESGGGGAGGGGPVCNDRGTVTCNGAVLETCDAAGKLTTADCMILAACDAAAGKCLPASPFGHLSAGQALACVVEDDATRTVDCWGNNDGGGLVPTDPRGIVPTAEQVMGLSSVRQVAVGAGQQCAVVDDGSVLCWGATNYAESGVLGCGEIPPTKVAQLPTAVEVRVAERCSCARLTDGTVDCWGDPGTGCFGTATKVEGAIPTPQQVKGVSGAVALRVGTYSPSCALLASGRVLCWDPNNVPTDVGVSGALEVEVSGFAVFIRTTSLGVVWTAPSSGSGPGFLPPTKYEGVGALTAMSAGDAFCDLLPTGGAACALFDDPPFPAPMPIPGLTAPVAEIAAGSSYPGAYGVGFQCLLLAGKPIASGVSCWGDDFFGEVGVDQPENITTPAPVTGLAGTAASLSTGQQSTTVVLSTGAVSTWGATTSLLPMEASTPTAVSFLGTGNAAVNVNDADDDAYVITTTGSLQLYNAMTLMPGARLDSSGYDDFVDARDYSNWDIGLRAGGAIVLYADTGDANSAGIFGDGTTVTSAAGVTPTVPLAGTVTGIAAFGDDNDSFPAHVCAIVAPALYCWGSNEAGEAGSGVPADGATVDTPTQVPIPGNDPIVSVAAGRFFTCAVGGTAGNVYCWGANDRGQLGVQNAQGGATPVQIPGISAVSVSAREAHVCARLMNETVACWGANDAGQVGDGTLTDQATPYVVEGAGGAPIADVKEVSVGPEHSCVLLTGGTVTCWGSSYNGQIGTGVTGFYPSPEHVLGL
jgi:hypothetical protein